MAVDLQGIARLVGVPGVGEPAAPASTGTAGFATTVRRAGEISPFETVIRKAEVEQAKPASATAVDTAPGAEAVKAKSADKARKTFEAFALQVFIGSMLPKENEKLFGTGSAGKLWQSLLAEKLADQITASGRLKLLPDEPAAAAPVQGAPDANTKEPSGKAG